MGRNDNELRNNFKTILQLFSSFSRFSRFTTHPPASARHILNRKRAIKSGMVSTPSGPSNDGCERSAYVVRVCVGVGGAGRRRDSREWRWVSAVAGRRCERG